MVTEFEPLNVSALSVPETMPAFMLRSATCAAPIASDSVPNALESRTRASLPPRLGRTILRTVWLVNPVLVVLAGSGATGLAPHVATQVSTAFFGPAKPLQAARHNASTSLKNSGIINTKSLLHGTKPLSRRFL